MADARIAVAAPDVRMPAYGLEPVAVVYVTIDNSDDALSQTQWAAWFRRVGLTLRDIADRVTGQWVSEPASAWQSACWRVEVRLSWVDDVKAALAVSSRTFGGKPIGWAASSGVEMIGQDWKRPEGGLVAGGQWSL